MENNIIKLNQKEINSVFGGMIDIHAMRAGGGVRMAGGMMVFYCGFGVLGSIAGLSIGILATIIYYEHETIAVILSCAKECTYNRGITTNALKEEKKKVLNLAYLTQRFD